MPEFLSVLCQSSQSVPLAELRSFIRHGWFFEEGKAHSCSGKALRH